MSSTLPRDPALPQLAVALDGAAMAQVFAGALHGPQLLLCEVDRVKYRPQRNCSVSYRLQLRDAQRGEFEQLVAARFCTGGDAARRHRHARERSWVASTAGPALQHVPALDMLAFWLPNDAKLDALRLICDDAELRRRCLGSVVATLAGSQARLIDHQTRLIQVVPELRACARVTLRVQCEPGAAPSAYTLYAKADIERSGAALHAAMQALRDSPAHAQGRLHTPRPVLWQPATGLHWQLAVPGRALQARVGAALSMRVGHQLAAFHATPVSAVPFIDVAGLRAQSQQATELLGCVEPAWQTLLARLSRRLDDGAAAWAGQAQATLHGDLHPANILIDRTQLSFVDLDSVQHGPAVFELGSWAAYLIYRAVLDGAPVQSSAPAWHAFISAYAGAAGQAIDPSLLAWSTAHHLLCRRAWAGLAALKPGRFAAVPALLAQADAIARAGTIDAAFGMAREAA